MVVLWHLPAVGPLPDTSIIKGSYLFTDFFFVLSGFIIFDSYHDRLRDGFGLARFMLLRFGRLYPLHLFVLALFALDEVARYGAVTGSESFRPPFSDPNGISSLGLHLSLLNAYGFEPISSWNFPAWSIGAEFYTYLVFAVLILASGSALPYSLVAIFVVSMAVLLQSGSANINLGHDLGFARCAAGFALGALCQRFASRFGSCGLNLGRYATLAEAITLAGVFAFVAVAGENRASFAAPLLFCAVLVVFTGDAGYIGRILRMSPFTFIGKVSYSVYLIHIYFLSHATSMVRSVGAGTGTEITTTMKFGNIEAIAFGAEPWQGTLAFFLIFPPLLLVSAAIHRLVEIPSRNLSRRLVGHMQVTLERGAQDRTAEG